MNAIIFDGIFMYFWQMVKQISSLQNSFIKELFQLNEKSRIRKKEKRFLIEGLREISLAIKGNYEIETILFDNEIISLDHIKKLIKIDTDSFIEALRRIWIHCPWLEAWVLR